MLRRLSAAYFSGAVAGLVATLAVWIAARADLIAMIQVSYMPALTREWLQTRLLCGSLWGLGYPIVARRGFTSVRAGLVLSLFPSAAELLYVLPNAGQDMFGLRLGTLMPAVVLLANALWGWVVAKTMTRLVG